MSLSARELPDPIIVTPSAIAESATVGAASPVYSYVANNPIKFIDSNELRFEVVGPNSRKRITRSHIDAAMQDPVIGWIVAEMDQDPNFVYEMNVSDDLEADGADGPYTESTSSGGRGLRATTSLRVTMSGTNSVTASGDT